MTNEKRAKMWAEKFHAKAVKAAGKGLNLARLQAQAYVQFEASVKAPTRMVQPRNGGAPYPVATTPATPGAPLRVVSDRYRGSFYSEMISENEAIVGNFARAPEEVFRTAFGNAQADQGTGFNYPVWHEVIQAQHKTFTPALERHIDDLSLIVGREVVAELS